MNGEPEIPPRSDLPPVPAAGPVDWLPWGDAAFARARSGDLPILLRIVDAAGGGDGPSDPDGVTDPGLAAFLGRHFVTIRVDRDERPDLDRTATALVQAMTGGVGWPLEVFLTPGLEPFHGRVSSPADGPDGLRGWRAVLDQVVELWRDRRGDLLTVAGEMASRLRSMAAHDPANAFPAGARELHGAGQAFLHDHDPVHGGFGTAPKFPRPDVPLYLLRYARRFCDDTAREAVLRTCDRMASGGIRDPLGGGFARYAADDRWFFAPSERRLSDNAQILGLYLEAFLESGEPGPAATARGILGHVSRDLTHPRGGFLTGERTGAGGCPEPSDCWTLDAIRAVLTPDEAGLVIRRYGLTEEGNLHEPGIPPEWAGRNVLAVADPALSDAEGSRLVSAHRKMLDARAGRAPVRRDRRIFAAWNGMMIGAAARAHAVLGDADPLGMAERALDFVRSNLWDRAAGMLHDFWCDGERGGLERLDGHAHLLAGVVDLYEATLDPDHLGFAVELAGAMVRRFHDPVEGGFWMTGAGTRDLVVRWKDCDDGTEPSGNSVAALALLRLSAICGRPEWRRAAEQALRLFAQRLHQQPHGVPHLLMALDFSLQEPRRVVIAGDPHHGVGAALLRAAHRGRDSNRVLLGTRGPVDPAVGGLPAGPGEAVAWCGTDPADLRPVRDPEGVLAFLAGDPPVG